MSSLHETESPRAAADRILTTIEATAWTPEEAQRLEGLVAEAGEPVAAGALHAVLERSATFFVEQPGGEA
jgi:hypothetical protein